MESKIFITHLKFENEGQEAKLQIVPLLTIGTLLNVAQRIKPFSISFSNVFAGVTLASLLP